MKNFLPLLLCLVLYNADLKAQGNPYIVADNGNRMSSCEDTLITLEHIYNKLGIRDLNDENDNVSNYRVLRLNGSLITEEELTSFKYSDHYSVFVHKRDVPYSNGNAGVTVFCNVITPPTSLFTVDSLKYTVEKEATINYVRDFFSSINIWSSGLDEELLQDRILFIDTEEGVEKPISQVPDWSIRGKGLYRIRYNVAVCGVDDLFRDTLFVKIQESLCNQITIKNVPPVCLDGTLDIRPYVYVNNEVATQLELDEMTFKDMSLVGSTTPGGVIDPAAINISSMYNAITNYPNIYIEYQPNIVLGNCKNYNQILTTKVPTGISASGVVVSLNNNGTTNVFELERDFYGFDGQFNKQIVKSLYVDNFNVFEGTTLDFYTDQGLQNLVTGDNLSEGTYHVKATNNACPNDMTIFKIKVIDRNFQLTWFSEENIGKGYYTFIAPQYEGATYSWNVWGASIVNGLNTNEIRVYYSENAHKNVSVLCKITLPSGRTLEGGTLGSALYLTAVGDEGELEILEPEIITSVHDPASTLANVMAYPNPAENTFMISGEGEFEIAVYNTLGQLVHEDKAYTANTPISVQSEGVHIVRLNKNNKSKTIKVVLK